MTLPLSEGNKKPQRTLCGFCVITDLCGLTFGVVGF